MTGTVRAERDGPLAWITIDNVERRNALTGEMFAALARHMADLDADPGVRAIVLRGAGDRAFAAGADVSDLGAGVRPASGAGASADSAAGTPTGSAPSTPTGSAPGTPAGFAAGTPTIAMIRGACIGGGLLLALMCDVRLAGDDARFGIPASKLGVAYPYDGVRRLLAAAGPAAAGEILLTGATFGAEDALRWGLVSRVVSGPDLEASAREMAASIANGAPLSARAARASIRAAVAGSPPDAVEEAERAIAACWVSEDLREGQQAFLEKRPPHFTGH